MNSQERELARLELRGERDVLEAMREHYKVALERVNEEIKRLAGRDDLSGIRQRQFQEALAEQIGGIIDDLGNSCYRTLEQYLYECYEQGFVGTMYNLQRQGVPLAFPINQEAMARAVTTTADGVKLSKRMYGNVSKLQTQVMAEITRGFADASHVTKTAERIAAETDIAAEIRRNVKGRSNQAFKRAMTIARTEKGRVLSDSRLLAMQKAKDAGADVVKQWDATMDSRTRDDHRKLNGQIRELDEPFEVRGHKGMAPHKFGRPEQDINCRCVVLQRSRTALEMPGNLDGVAWDGVNQCYVDLSDAESYADFKSRYDGLVASRGKTIRMKDINYARFDAIAATEETEYGETYNVRTGERVDAASGTAHSVEISIPDDKHPEDYYVVHSHPTGGTFSASDIVGLCEAKISGIEARNPHSKERWSMTPTEDAMWEDFGDACFGHYARRAREIEDEMRSKYGINEIWESREAVQEANAMLRDDMHKWYIKNSSRFGFNYTYPEEE